MPFVPSHKRRFKANKVFTDRERPVTLFVASEEVVGIRHP
jgi:hypothetical protein